MLLASFNCKNLGCESVGIGKYETCSYVSLLEIFFVFPYFLLTFQTIYSKTKGQLWSLKAAQPVGNVMFTMEF